MEGLLEIVVAQELLNRGEIDKDEFTTFFGGRTVMRFDTLEHAANFGRRFVQDYLVPKYGLEEATRFPMAKTEPARWIRSLDEGAKIIGEYIGEIPREKPPEEIWLVVPDDKYHEVQEYLDSLK
ncbi:hypothetical protein HYW19_00950 [Candidatus Woesearchaeota archaeon]|nr:hypothetical protein [Candidatus Woesearchaeota archaeon]